MAREFGTVQPAEAPAGIKDTELRRWLSRVQIADKVYNEWCTEWKVDVLEDYALGHQWKEEIPDTHYTINLCYPTIETQIPSMLFFRPKLHVIPRPPRADDPGTNLDQRATLLENTAQTFLSRRETGAMESVNLAVREHFYRFGVVEVCYTLDYTDNPNVGRPVLREDGSEMRDSGGEKVLQGAQVPSADNLYLKWIPASTFRVGTTASYNVTEFNDWLGYYEWQYRDDILANPTFKNKGQVRNSGALSTRYLNPENLEDPEDKRRFEMVKVWKVWDLRKKVRHVFAEGANKFFVKDEPWTRTPAGKPFHPFAFLRRHPILQFWYPLPPMYNWISPQDELNETRDMQKVHRKRAYRRYLVQQGSIDPAELRKLETGGDMVHAEVSRLDCIQPMEDAPLDRAVTLNIPTTKEDFMNVSGTSGDRRGVAESETATQAAIIDTNARIREHYSRQAVGEFFARVCWLMLETIRAKFTLPMVVQVNVDPQAPFAPYEALNVAAVWQQVAAPELGDMEFEVAVDLESLSPATEDQMRQQWTQVLSILSNPTLLIALLASPTLLRKTLAFYGIRTDKEVGDITLAMQAVLAALAAQQQQAVMEKAGTAGGKPSSPGPGPSGTGPQQPQQVQDIMRQLEAQGVGTEGITPQ